ncbi:peptidoglycan bridge formation glycyltransferase FemA/FemB family protein [Candidatus Gracilibacteria bacterium]|nr:peptidoglycan bridge formation glycyltransferase FemA/FemB family protein [Candidatus Gracilibacteria bacterium]
MNNPTATIFQSDAWLRFQQALPGREAGTISSGSESLYWAIIPTLLGKRYLYINHGLGTQSLTHYWPQLVALAKAKKCIYIKLEPLWPENDPREAELVTLRCKPSTFAIQPQTTLLLDLTLSTEDLLKQMKPKGRYNIKIAAKNNITYHSFDADHPELTTALSAFYKLLHTTATRDHFGIHTVEYYHQFLAKLSPQSKLYLAYHQDQVIAGMIVTLYQTESIYYYGASSSEHRELMATYGLQWQVIQEMKAAGATTYDFLGIAPSDASSQHPLAGVTEFKKKFGGTVQTWTGTYHYILSPLFYSLIHAPKIILHKIKH